MPRKKVQIISPEEEEENNENQNENPEFEIDINQRDETQSNASTKTESSDDAVDINKSGIEFKDIKDNQPDVLAIEDENKDKQEKQHASQSRDNDRYMRQLQRDQLRLDREIKKENVKQSRDDEKIKKESGTYGGDECIKLRAHICRYRSHKRFGAFLKKEGFKLDNKLLNKMNKTQLDELLGSVKFAVCNMNQSNMFKQIANAGVSGAEMMGCKFGLKINGLSVSLQQNQEYHDLIDEILFERQLLFYTKPEYRLAMLVVQTGATLHYTNSALANMSDEQRDTFLSSIRQGNANVEQRNSDLLS